MATQFAFGKIVTDGLVLSVDAADKNSYPDSGTTWTDMTGRGNNGDIKSGVSYSNNSFTFTLDSTNQLIDINNSPDLNYAYDNWAYSMWMKINFDDNGSWVQLFIKGNDNGNRRPGIWFYSGATSRFHFTWSATGQEQQTLDTTDPLTPPIGVWANWVFQSRNGVLMVFKNAVQDANTLAISDRNLNNEPLHIGGYNYRSPGINLASFMLYNRSLTDEEILQNYNAQKSRFGL
jgi:hypothetical protein